MDIKATLLNELGEYYTNNITWEEIQDTDFNELDLDSLDKIEVIMAVEERLKIEIRDEDLANVDTPNQLLVVVTNIVAKK